MRCPTDDVVLPPFDPEKNENGAESWCSSFNSIAEDKGWSSITTVAKAGKSLRGSVLLWYETLMRVEHTKFLKITSKIHETYPKHYRNIDIGGSGIFW